jgi:hypothetical protein
VRIALACRTVPLILILRQNLCFVRVFLLPLVCLRTGVLESQVHRRDCMDLRYNEWLPDAARPDGNSLPHIGALLATPQKCPRRLSCPTGM